MAQFQQVRMELYPHQYCELVEMLMAKHKAYMASTASLRRRW